MEKLLQVCSFVYKTGRIEEMPIYLHRCLFAEWVGSQFVQILMTDLGLMMLINNVMQSAEDDNGAYENCMTSPLMSCDKEILIIGGGDGKLADKVHSLNPQAFITVVDIEKGIVELCRQYFRQTVFESKRVNLVIKDGSSFLEENLACKKKFDLILVDLTDEPVMSGDVEFKAFYDRLIRLVFENLSAGGRVCIQAGAVEVCERLINPAVILHRILRKHFWKIEMLSSRVPSFEPDVALFLCASNPILLPC